MGNPLLFIFLAAIAIAAALGMLFSRNAVHSALFLVLNFATIAVFYIVLNAPFIAMVQVTVYAGAIVVLFLIVIMLLRAERLRSLGTLSGSDRWRCGYWGRWRGRHRGHFGKWHQRLRNFGRGRCGRGGR